MANDRLSNRYESCLDSVNFIVQSVKQTFSRGNRFAMNGETTVYSFFLSLLLSTSVIFIGRCSRI